MGAGVLELLGATAVELKVDATVVVLLIGAMVVGLDVGACVVDVVGGGVLLVVAAACPVMWQTWRHFDMLLHVHMGSTSASKRK